MSKSKVSPNNLYDHIKPMYSGVITPDISAEVDNFSHVRFSRSFLITIFKQFIAGQKHIPIEKFEIDLFEATKFFHEKLHGKEMSVKCVEKIHHFQQLLSNGIQLDQQHQSPLKQKIDSLIRSNPLITFQYELFIKMLEIWNGLIFKWGIGNFNDYDYRYSGRALNIKLLDLHTINQGFISIDVIWMSCKIFTEPINVIANTFLVEYAIVLHEQIRICFEVFLDLNPKIIDPNYDIEKTLAFNSKLYRMFSNDVIPEENLCNFKHAELKVVKGIAKCFKIPNPKVDEAYNCLKELELGYRTFEKCLVASILKAAGRVNF